MPEMTPLKSSNLDAAGYDPATGDLHITFKNGGTYVYENVSPALHRSLLNAPSPGAFFHKHIKGAHKFRRLGE